MVKNIDKKTHFPLNVLSKNQYSFYFRGQTPLQAEFNFLEIAKKIPRYGVDIHDAMVNMIFFI